MTADTLAAIRERHRPCDCDRATGGPMWRGAPQPHCRHDRQGTGPCDTARVLALLDAEAARHREAGLDVETLARALFLYRTSSNVPLPDDFWQRQSDTMQEPFRAEARAVLARLRAAEARQEQP